MADTLLIMTSAMIDLLGLFLLGSATLEPLWAAGVAATLAPFCDRALLTLVGG